MGNLCWFSLSQSVGERICLYPQSMEFKGKALRPFLGQLLFLKKQQEELKWLFLLSLGAIPLSLSNSLLWVRSLMFISVALIPYTAPNTGLQRSLLNEFLKITEQVWKPYWFLVQDLFPCCKVSRLWSKKDVLESWLCYLVICLRSSLGLFFLFFNSVVSQRQSGSPPYSSTESAFV